MAQRREHFEGIEPVAARTRGCEQYMALGERWTQLRVCLTCGHSAAARIRRTRMRSRISRKLDR